MSYNNNYNNNNYNQAPKKRKSGAKILQGQKNGKDYLGVNAWFHRKKTGLITISGFVNSNSVTYQNQQGEESVSMLFEVFYKDTGAKHLEVGFLKRSTGKVFLKKLGIIISTKKNYAGFI